MAPLIPTELTQDVVRVVGISLLAGGLTLGLAIVYRWYGQRQLPVGLSLLAGFGVVALYLNSTAALGQAIEGAEGLLDLSAVFVNIATFVLAGIAAVVGSGIGDRLGQVVSAGAGTRAFDDEVSRIVTATGRSIAVELPGEIDDLEGYDPEPDAVKSELSGKTLLFPRGLTLGELQNRLVARLEDDYGVGHVSVELQSDGAVTHLAVGDRAAGLGPTLPPESVATAIRADPPFSASVGDIVEVRRRDEESTRLATGEFRSSRNDVVTLALDERDAEALDPGERYRLVTLPRDDRADGEFAGVLRVADVSFGEVAIQSSSALEGIPTGALDVTVVAVGAADGTLDAIPSRDRVLEAGDRVYVLTTPKRRQRLEAAARAGRS